MRSKLALLCLLKLTTYAGCSLSNRNDIFGLDSSFCLRDTVFLTPSVVRSEQKKLQISPVHQINVPFKTATFGMGCFWGAESLYGGTRGVLRTTVGYAGGLMDSPAYRNLGDHTEVLEIDYDPTVTSFHDLLHLFWNNHEYGLTNPIKRQYRSLILYHDNEQKSIAEASLAEEQERRKGETITTSIEPKKNFYPAESYHQKYRLQGHANLCETLGLNEKLLQTSYVATKLNGYLAGAGTVANLLEEMDTMGLTPKQKEYCIHYTEKNEGQGLYC